MSSITVSGPRERRQRVELHAVVNKIDFVIEAMGYEPAAVLKEKGAPICRCNSCMEARRSGREGQT